MDKIIHFIINFSHYSEGTVDHGDISSTVIWEYMNGIQISRFPETGNWISFSGVLINTVSYIYCYYNLLSGVPLSLEDIPEFGKYVNIFAGITMSCGKCLFLYLKKDELKELMAVLSDASLKLKLRGQSDPSVRKLRNSAYANEMTVFISSIVFCLFFVGAVYFQCYQQRELVIPVYSPIEIPYFHGNYPVAFILQLLICFVIAATLNFTNVLIGNLYNQIVLHLEVLHYDLKVIDEDHTGLFTSAGPKFSEAIRQRFVNYQEIVAMHNRCNRCMRELFINDVLASIIAVVFSCVEIGIVVNQDVKSCFRPGIYCFFIYTLLFFWCWLGTRLAHKSSQLVVSAFIYKESVNTVDVQKLLLQFIQMVQKPLTIEAKPLFVVNFDIFVNIVRLSYQFTTVFKKFSADS